MGFQRVTVNLGGGVSHRELDGRRYAVVPCVLMAEGVWEGSEGPFFYSAKSLQNACPSWNNKPIVVYHPEVDGVPVSAASPAVLASQGCGMLLNVRWEDDKQKGDAWLDEEKTNKVDDRIIPMLERGEKIETSTGLIVDALDVANEKGEGVHKGKKYTRIADNHRPDHFAILPDRRGAFSVADGGGLLANEYKPGLHTKLVLLNGEPKWKVTENGKTEYLDEITVDNRTFSAKERQKAASSGAAMKDGSFPIENEQDLKNAIQAYGRAKNKAAAKRHIIKRAKALGKTSLLPDDWKVSANEAVQALAANEMSFTDVSTAVCQLLDEKFQKPGYYWNGYIVDVFPTFVVYRADGKYYSQSYSMQDGVPQLTGDPTEVVRVTEYRTANDGKYIGNSAVEFVPNKEPQMAFDRKAHITKLIGNGFEEKDRAELEKLPDALLEKIEPKKKEEPAKDTQTNNQLVANSAQEAAPATVEEWLKQTKAPLPVQNSVLRSLQRDAAHKAGLVKTILANAANPFSETFLNGKDIQELEGLAAFASASAKQQQDAVPDPTNGGMFRQGYAFPASGAPVANQGYSQGGVPEDEEILPMPSINNYRAADDKTKAG